MPSRSIPIRWGRKGRLLGRLGQGLTIFAAGVLVIVVLNLWGRL